MGRDRTVVKIRPVDNDYWVFLEKYKGKPVSKDPVGFLGLSLGIEGDLLRLKHPKLAMVKLFKEGVDVKRKVLPDGRIHLMVFEVPEESLQEIAEHILEKGSRSSYGFYKLFDDVIEEEGRARALLQLKEQYGKRTIDIIDSTVKKLIAKGYGRMKAVNTLRRLASLIKERDPELAEDLEQKANEIIMNLEYEAKAEKVAEELELKQEEEEVRKLISKPDLKKVFKKFIPESY